MLSRRITSLFLLLLIIFSVINTFFDEEVVREAKAGTPSNWLSGFTYCKEVTVTNKVDDYQSKIVIGFDSSVSGVDVHCEGHCQADFDDIRFAYSNGTELPYWRESYASSSKATFWVKNIYNDSTFYLYYGNSTVSTTSNGTATFIFFDDFDTFDTNVWGDQTPNASVSASSGVLHITGDETNDDENFVYTKSSFSYTNVWLEVKAKRVTEASGYYSNVPKVGISDDDTTLYTNEAHYIIYQGSPKYDIRHLYWTGGSQGESPFPTLYDGSDVITGYYIWRIKKLANGTNADYMTSWLTTEYTNEYTNTEYNLPNFTFYIHLGTRDSCDADFDWVRLRKAVATEPTLSFGSEQSEGGGGEGLTPSSGWQWFRQLNISNSSANYQIKLRLYENDNTKDDPTNGTLDLAGKCENFPNDIRFGTTNNLSNTTQLAQWIEEETATYVDIWIKLPSDVSNTIYLYVGNQNASRYSDGDDTFIFFDDFSYLSAFDSSKWDKVGSGDVKKHTTLLFTASHGGQGLATDGTYFYWGHNNGAGVNGTIYKIDMDGNEIDSFDGPEHSAGLDWWGTHDTLLAITYSSSGSLQRIWEINASTGNKIQEWNLDGVDYGRGGHIAWKEGDTVYFLSSDSSWNFKIREVTLHDDGTYTLGDVWSHSSLGVSQGLDYVNGYLYYLYDTGISKLQLNDNGTITVLETLSSFPDGTTEKEGLTYLDGRFHYGNTNLKIYRIENQISIDISSYSTSIYSKNQFGTWTAIRCKWRATSTSLHYPGFGYGNKGSSTPDIVDDSYNAHGITIGNIHGAESFVRGRQSNDGTNRAETGNICSTQNNFHVYEIRRKSSSSEFVVDDGTPSSLSTYYPTEDLYIGIGGHHRTGDSGQSIADWILIRKYASPEPSWSSFGTWQSINAPPTVSNPFPSNGSTDIQLQPTCHIDVSDADGDTMTLYWYENSTGSWVLRQTNSSISNGTYYWTFTQASQEGTTYWWKVAVNDGTDNTTAIYHFTTASSNVVCDQNVYDASGNTVSYNWGNWTAQPGDTNVDGGGNKTYIKATNSGTIAGDATISWSYAYLANGSYQIPFSLNGNPNIKYYWGTGNTPNDVTTWNNATDSDATFVISVPSGSTLWVYYEILQIPTAIPAGVYTQTFTWTST